MNDAHPQIRLTRDQESENEYSLMLPGADPGEPGLAPLTREKLVSTPNFVAQFFLFTVKS